MTTASRDDLQRAFDRYRVRHDLAKAEDKLRAACGTNVVAEVADDKITAGFKALEIPSAVLNTLGIGPLKPTKLPPPVEGQSVEARLSEMAASIYKK